MKTYKFFFFFLFLLPFTSIGQKQKNLSDSVQVRKIFDIAEAIIKEYAPDKRTAIFMIMADSAGDNYFETTELKAAQKFSDTLIKEGIKIPVQTLPAKNLGEKIYALVNLSVVNIRSNPKNAAELATQSLLGTPLDILKKEGYYYFVRTPDGYISWLDAGAISLKSAAEMDNWKQKDKLVFMDDYGHAYSNSDRKSQRVSDLVMGDILVNDGKQKGFYKVIFPDGRAAFIPQEQMTDYKNWIKRPSPNSEQIIEIAKTMIGVPYLWGGTSVKGVDCSGFTKTAFFMNGVIIPRDASQQVMAGEPVAVLKNDRLNLQEALKNLKSGDLIFFASGKNKSPDARVTHVALYIGNGEFIHASGNVRISSMKPDAPNYDDFETRTVVAARRYLGNVGTTGIQSVATHPAYQEK
ncbi:C40 family peptidase [Dyadobacter frigoris]|uniref:NlpC/P60 family protein n=1 Tax=Dyadobacter frigoris TaxID=2576211 RepID=A0A4U6D5C7_9BACT|nr:C40 family peptidase [Dyadobacter frigoris]TKT91407.1 NlpC/P60 family protein [Dyadobacter frigoris]GLU52041.1 cytochrome c [Dyadobacter frigoris]